MTKVRHLLGISGGKDSAALAIYLKNKYPSLPIEYYTCDTGKELDETYLLIERLEGYLGKKIIKLNAAENSSEAPFDHVLKMYGGYLPSSNARWCTKKLKLEPFEKFVGNDNVISYVGIRGDEDREGYISRKPNIQSIFPFRQNIWSGDVVSKLLSNGNLDLISTLFNDIDFANEQSRFREILKQPISINFSQKHKLQLLLDISIKNFNRLVFSFLKTTSYPLSQENEYVLLDNEEILIRSDIFTILMESGVGVPQYYNKLDFDVNGKTGEYSRSRSGCYFCFFQQKIEWIWLYEQHPEKFKMAMDYEKDGYSWNQEETLAEMIKPDRMQHIKEDYLKRSQKNSEKKSPYLLDILGEAEGEGCASCFI